ncbi:glial cell line-derived neurotrophic factor-like [Oncorhynchus nerka]|uniref:glial cell line-derived neurotrophic factor-like n=1 Tax=Oncorhynchus nerka TaxID=8023 RepID=UPI0011320C85|nr:glial cell line-derived neurotrophic factor-like [Oncorhynchus nerka]
MKLWDVLATCLLLLSSVSTRPLYQNLQPAKRAHYSDWHSDSLSPSVEEPEPEFQSESHSLQEISMEEKYDITGPYPDQFEDVMDFIKATIGRLRRSSEPAGGSRGRREQREQGRQRGAANIDRRGGGRGVGRGGRGEKKGRGRGGKGRSSDRAEQRMKPVEGRGCLLKEVHLNVTDLGLGYRTKEELIFRYCSGPCSDAETNYDKILNNLTHNKKLVKDTPSRTCCRPITFDDDLSFLDDNNEDYHILRKHSARKCGCV